MRRLLTLNIPGTMYHLGINHANPYVITAGNPGRIKRLIPYLIGTQVTESDRSLVTVNGTYAGLPITAFSTGMGPASVAITLPEIVEACDKTFMVILRLGTAGALDKRLKIGDFVITDHAQRAESTSDKIMGPFYRARASPEVIATLQMRAIDWKLESQQVYTGSTRTTDDFYWDARASKSRSFLHKAFEQVAYGGILGVSMEASAHFAVRDWYNKHDNRNIKAGELLVVSDSIGEEEHVDATEFLQRQQEIEKAQIKIGLETLLALSFARH